MTLQCKTCDEPVKIVHDRTGLENGPDGHPAMPAGMAAGMPVRGTPAVSAGERRKAFEQRYRQVTITPPGNGRRFWKATWPGMSKEDAAAARHSSCDGLLDYLEARFGAGTPGAVAGDAG